MIEVNVIWQVVYANPVDGALNLVVTNFFVGECFHDTIPLLIDEFLPVGIEASIVLDVGVGIYML